MLKKQLLMILAVTAQSILAAGTISISINQPVTVQSSTMIPAGTIEPLVTRVRTIQSNAQLFARLMIAPLLASVAGLSWYHNSMARWLQDPSRWCTWKQQVSVSALQELPITCTLQELMNDSERRYKTLETSPFAQLVIDIHAEKQILERYRLYVSCYRWMRLGVVAPRAIATVDKALERISFIESLIQQGYVMAKAQLTGNA